MNYQLIYMARRAREPVIEAQYALRAKQLDLEAAEKKWNKWIASQISCSSEEIEFSNISCIADGIPTHVYAPKQGKQYKYCIFCDCDNAPDL
jgi:hypothetical protein